MYNRLCKFPEKKEIFTIFNFDLDKTLNQPCINLSKRRKKKRKQLDYDNYCCGIFVDFQTLFHTVDHNIFLKKLEHHAVSDISNNWFASYLSNRKQFVSINEFCCNLADIK